MSAKLALPGRHQVIVTLPSADVDDLLPAGEVLAQEGFLTWVLAADALADLPDLLQAFGRRALIGVGGLERPEQVVEAAEAGERVRLAAELADLRTSVRAEKIGEVAAAFDGIHNIHRAVDVGSVDEVIAATDLRPKIIASPEKGLGLASS